MIILKQRVKLYCFQVGYFNTEYPQPLLRNNVHILLLIFSRLSIMLGTELQPIDTPCIETLLVHELLMYTNP